MDESENSNVSKTLEETLVNTTAAPTSEREEHGQSTTGTTNRVSKERLKQNVCLESYVERDPMFVIVDSSCESNPSSRELLTRNNALSRDAEMPKNLKRHVLPIDIPSTSKEIIEPFHSSFIDSDSREELQMIEINLQSENELPIDDDGDEDDSDSIVISYLKNKDKLINNDGLLVFTKKKSSLLDDVPKMETILEDEQFSPFVISPHSSGKSMSLKKISEHSLELHIPSYPGSPRSLDLASRESYESERYYHSPHLREAIEFLHADKELLIAAETGNDKMLEIILRRAETNVQEIDHLGRNALHLAVYSGNIRAVEMLLKAGVNPNIKDSLGITPLSLCLMRSPSLIIAEMLFDYGAKILPRSSPIDTGLFMQYVMMCTPTEEENKILRLLVNKGALINDPDAPGGRQALHFAAMSNNCTLIRILVELGAYLYLTNHRNETPRQVAATFNCTEAHDLLADLEEAELNSPSMHMF